MNDNPRAKAARKVLLFAVMGYLAPLAAVIAGCLWAEGAYRVVEAVAIWAALRAILWSLGELFPIRMPIEADALDDLRALARDRGLGNLRLLRVSFLGDGTEYGAACLRVFGPPRVYLTGGLVENLDAPQLRAVFAHELAHAELGHSRKNLALRLLGDLVVVAAAALAFTAMEQAYGGFYPARWVGGIGSCVVASELLRRTAGLRRRHELAADRRAMEITGDPQALASAFRKLAELSGVTDTAWIERRIVLAAQHARRSRPAGEAIPA